MQRQAIVSEASSAYAVAKAKKETAADELGDCQQTLQLNHGEIARKLEAAEPGTRWLELEAAVAVV